MQLLWCFLAFTLDNFQTIVAIEDRTVKLFPSGPYGELVGNFPLLFNMEGNWESLDMSYASGSQPKVDVFIVRGTLPAQPPVEKCYRVIQEKSNLLYMLYHYKLFNQNMWEVQFKKGGQQHGHRKDFLHIFQLQSLKFECSLSIMPTISGKDVTWPRFFTLDNTGLRTKFFHDTTNSNYLLLLSKIPQADKMDENTVGVKYCLWKGEMFQLDLAPVEKIQLEMAIASVKRVLRSKFQQEAEYQQQHASSSSAVEFNAVNRTKDAEVPNSNRCHAESMLKAPENLPLQSSVAQSVPEINGSSTMPDKLLPTTGITLAAKSNLEFLTTSNVSLVQSSRNNRTLSPTQNIVIVPALQPGHLELRGIGEVYIHQFGMVEEKDFVIKYIHNATYIAHIIKGHPVKFTVSKHKHGLVLDSNNLFRAGTHINPNNPSNKLVREVETDSQELAAFQYMEFERITIHKLGTSGELSITSYDANIETSSCSRLILELATTNILTASAIFGVFISNIADPSVVQYFQSIAYETVSGFPDTFLLHYIQIPFIVPPTINNAFIHAYLKEDKKFKWSVAVTLTSKRYNPVSSLLTVSAIYGSSPNDVLQFYLSKRPQPETTENNQTVVLCKLVEDKAQIFFKCSHQKSSCLSF